MRASGIFFEIFEWFVDVIRHYDETPGASEPPLFPGRLDDGHKPCDGLSSLRDDNLIPADRPFDQFGENLLRLFHVDGLHGADPQIKMIC
jgi:hypothetical protein